MEMKRNKKYIPNYTIEDILLMEEYKVKETEVSTEVPTNRELDIIV